MQYQYYYDAVRDAEPVITLELPKKTGRVPKGTYRFLEYYCVDPGCDCRRVSVVVMNEKMKQKATISFGFDQQGPFGGPYLDAANRQSPYAEDLLGLFVQSLNSGPAWLERFYRHYLAVREKVEGQPYRGKAFPPPGKLQYHATPPPDLAAEIEQSLRNLQSGGKRPVPSGQPGKPPVGMAGTKRRSAERAEESMASFIARYVEEAQLGPAMNLMQLHSDLRGYLLNHEGAGEELAAMLPTLYQQSPQPDEQIQAALRLLYDSLDLLDQDLEDGRSYARRRMEDLQTALARHIFTENEDPDLCAAVTNVLVQSRVDLLPVLRQSNDTFIFTCASRSDLRDVPAEEVITGISRSFHSMGVTSPYEGAREVLEFLAANDVQTQGALIGEMFDVGEPLLREIAALMLFHPEAEVRLSVAEILASLDGKSLTPDLLLRLIISRNWFPEEIRRKVDQAIAKARKARVECAPMPKLPSAAIIFASPITPAGEQSFEVVVPDGSARCRLVLKEEEGIADCAVDSLPSRYEADNTLKALRKDPAFLESSVEHLDLRVCNALADGARLGKVPNHWLVRVAELLGRDRWRMIPLEAARELLFLQEELASQAPKLLEEREYRDSVESSGELFRDTPWLNGWRENDPAVEGEVAALSGKGKSADAAAVEAIVGIMEKRRDYWVERLVVTALWLNSSQKAPVKWHRLYHLAQAVADETVPFTEIPLMVSIAQATYHSYQSSKGRTLLRPAEVRKRT